MFSRTEMILGEEGINKLKNSRVAVFGVGGVGGYVVEALVRSGLGSIDLIDNDIVSLSNINRQIYATTKTVGRLKIDVAEERIYDINPSIKVYKHNVFYLPEIENTFNFEEYNYVADAIDTVTGKLNLAEKAYNFNIPIISSMGAGNKLDPTAFKVSDIYKTKVCPLAKVMRTELKKRGINKLKVVFSEEIPSKLKKPYFNKENKKQIPASIAFVPSVVGFIMAGEIIKDLVGYTPIN